jgi:hypothetical protein
MLIINLLLSLTLLTLNTGVVNKATITNLSYSHDSPIIVSHDGQNTTKNVDLNVLYPSRVSVILSDDQAKAVTKDFESKEIDMTYKAPEIKQPVKTVAVSKPVPKPIIKAATVQPVQSVPTVINTQPAPTTVADQSNPVPSTVLPDFETYIRQMCTQYGCDPDQLIRVMYCESGGVETRVSYNGLYFGLFQFSKSTFSANSKFITNANILNGYDQIQVAAKMFANGQASQWGCK